MQKAQSIAVSLWKHIQCWCCNKWWVVEDDDVSFSLRCPHCGAHNQVKEEG